MYRQIVFSLLLMAVWPLTTQGAEEAPAQDQVLALEAEPTGGDFTLNSLQGPVSTKDLRGKVIMLYFGYTKCPDVCPSSLAFMTQAMNELSAEEQKDVVGIFVSVDPKRDSVEILAEYAGYFHENYIGVTGSEAEIARVAKLFGAQYYTVELEDSAFGYAVNHSSATYMVDQRGGLRFVFPHETPPKVLLEAMRYLLTEGHT